MALLTNAAMTGIKEYIKRTVSYARYRIGSSTWKQVDVANVWIDSKGVVRIEVKIEPPQIEDHVYQVQIYDTAGQLWYEKYVSLDITSVAESFDYEVELTIVEVDK